MKQTSETSYITRIKVTGMKFSKGAMDNGTTFDSTTVYAETKFDTSRGNAWGSATTEYKLGKSDEFAKYPQIAFIADAEMENVTNGKNRSTIILQLQPVEAVKAAAPAAPAATPNRAAA